MVMYGGMYRRLLRYTAKYNVTSQETAFPNGTPKSIEKPKHSHVSSRTRPNDDARYGTIRSSIRTVLYLTYCTVPTVLYCTVHGQQRYGMRVGRSCSRAPLDDGAQMVFYRADAVLYSTVHGTHIVQPSKFGNADSECHTS
jgi:hypothetical protein